MKNILITGARSFVGSSIQRYLEQWPENYKVTTLDMESDQWNNFDFSAFETVYHVAGVAHSDIGKASEEVKAKYYSVNTELAINVAKKAKMSGCSQFIFMSSAIVYGDSAPIGKNKIITRNTPLQPVNFYGDSKAKAEKGLVTLEEDKFHVVILRCPMIYGKDGKGNFPILEKMALKMPLFPKINNGRSMLYITNLAEFVKLMIDNYESGVFWPCNKEYSNTSEIVKKIAECHGKHVILIPGFTWALKLMSHMTGLVNKAFGNLTYDVHLGDYKTNYRLYSLEESIVDTEGRTTY